MEYCIYLRKSRADKEAELHGEGETLARHEAALKTFALQLGIAISCIYREIVSGETISARPVMRQLLAEVEQGGWTGVFVMEIERLARGDTIDQGVMAQAFQFSGTKIYTPAKIYDPCNELDEEYFEFGLFMSRREYKTINRRLQRGRLASVKEGKYVGSGSPYGYNRVKLEGQKGYTLKPVQDQAAVVRMIYEWYVHGLEGVRLGPSAIAGKLNGLGLKPAKKASWPSSSIRDILHNPVYTGKIRWNFRPVVKHVSAGIRRQSRNRSGQFELVEGLHPAIVSDKVWETAQRLGRSNPVSKARSGTALKNPLAGLVVCGHCGKSMVRKAYQNGAPESLVCTTQGCAMPSAYLSQVEGRLFNALSAWLTDYTVPGVTEEAQARFSADAQALRRLECELADTRTQQSNLHDLLERGLYDSATFQKRTEILSTKARSLLDMIHRLSSRTDWGKGVPPETIAILEFYHKAQTPAQKNALLKKIIQQVVYVKTQGGRWKEQVFSLHIFPLIGGISPSYKTFGGTGTYGDDLSHRVSTDAEPDH